MNVYSMKWTNIERIRAGGLPHLKDRFSSETDPQNVYTPSTMLPPQVSTQHYCFN
jgi:hypothetical protein